LKNYITWFNLDQSKDEWFAELKNIALKSGFALNNKEFIEWTHVWKIWDAAMILRVVLCGQRNTPDLYETMQVMWKERVEKRLKNPSIFSK
jgi:glutamyl-tRNA synthetase